MRALRDKRVVLGVTGGIAAYKAAFLVRAMRRKGAKVRAVMTVAATKFITPLTFATLTEEPCLTDEDLFKDAGAVTHVELGRDADLFVIAPATANTIAKLANGFCDNLLTSAVLASKAPVLIVPSMHTSMWENEIVQENVRRLRGSRYRVMVPSVGDLACGDSGPGRFPEIEDILTEAAAACSNQDLSGRRIVITAGPTREPIDAVRFISNPSTGLMGVSLARAAIVRGATVTLIAGPLAVPVPTPPSDDPCRLRVKQVMTATEMLEAVRTALADADALIMSAAVCDERPAETVTRKLHKHELPQTLRLEPNPDILLSLQSELKGRVVLGFAAETDLIEESGRRKLHDKNLDLLFANRISATSGFGFSLSEGVLLAADGSRHDIPPMPKEDLADELLDAVSMRLPSSTSNSVKTY